MKLLVALCCAFGGYFFLSEAAEVISLGQEASFNSELNNVKVSSRDVESAGKKFDCPFPFGQFPDPEDCSKYYLCIGGVSTNRKCRKDYQFDIFRLTCLHWLISVCGKNDKDKTTTRKPTDTTSGGIFTCPSFRGSYPHPGDCSKYYTCTFYIPSMKTCPENELFDVVQSSCRPAKGVHCGDRLRPGQLTSDDLTTNTEAITEIHTESPTPVTTPEDITTTTEPPVTTTTTELPVTTPKDIGTTEKHRETAPPDNDCHEDDVDCIIDETGDPDDWFKCPHDIGSYPHPSSDKLFIFCMNWIPSVKKCGMDLIFSKEKSTCIKI